MKVSLTVETFLEVTAAQVGIWRASVLMHLRHLSFKLLTALNWCTSCTKVLCLYFFSRTYLYNRGLILSLLSQKYLISICLKDESFTDLFNYRL